MDLTGKHILVVGAGISGVAVAKTVSRLGARVTLSDTKSAAELGAIPAVLTKNKITFVSGEQTEGLLDQADIVITSPGMPIQHSLLQKAMERGIEVVSEIEMAFRLTAAPFIAITGTNGKTTTTTLLGEILKNAGRKVVVGGNIGIPLSEAVCNLADDALVVAEISSFQLEGVKEFHPRACAILNLTPDHIDRHGTLRVYQAMKERIFAKQTVRDQLVLNYDDQLVRDMAARTSAQVIFFSHTQVLPAGAFVRDNYLVLAADGREERVCGIEEMGIRGGHNVQNALAACALAKVCGVSVAVMAATLRGFKGVEHRLEFVAEYRNIKYYNDSKATNPESSIVALQAFTEPLLLIAGGRDKGTDLGAFMREVKTHVRELILLGEAADRFAQAAKENGFLAIHRVKTLQDAVDLADGLARPGDSVLLSPACASYDMFHNYEERGSIFKQLVVGLGR